MIINIKKSILFKDPTIRFLNEYGNNLWQEMWRRHKQLNYTPRDMADYYHIKTGDRIKTQTIKRWIWRNKIYNKVEPVAKKGVECVNSAFFDEDEEKVLKELLKNFSEHPNTEILP